MLFRSQTRSFEQSAHEQAGNVNSPAAWMAHEDGRVCTIAQHILMHTETYKAFSIPLYRLPEGYCIVPIEPPIELLISMALRIDHGLGCPGYYDCLPIQLGPTHKQRMDATIADMRRVYEEAVGKGFYSDDRKEYYASLTASPMNVPPPSTQEVNE